MYASLSTGLLQFTIFNVDLYVLCIAFVPVNAYIVFRVEMLFIDMFGLSVNCIDRKFDIKQL